MIQPLLVTVAIIENEDKILLVKRTREPFKDCWSLISGCGAFKQTIEPIEAVKIEVKGDINCEFNPKFFNFYSENFDMPSLCLYFYGNIKGETKINEKYVSDFKWFSKKEILKLELAFDHKKVLDEYFIYLIKSS